MKATLPAKQTQNAKNLDQQKERVRTLLVIAYPFKTAIEARFWMSRSGDGASPVMCSVWIDNRYAGHGRANGYGYHKPSAALCAALTSAGIKLDEDIDGRGDDIMDDALIAVCSELGYNDVYVVRT
jgi:hypothetical protein